MSTGTHIIEKVVVEVNAWQIKTANDIKNNLNVFLKNEIFPVLEKLLQDYDRPDTVARFQKLELNVNLETWDKPEQVKYKILSEFEGQLQKRIENEGVSNQIAATNLTESENHLYNLTVDKNEAEIFLFFLENGFLPWHGNVQHIFSFQKKTNWQASFKKSNFVKALNNLLSKDESLFVRFFYQFPVEMVIAFITRINTHLAGVEDQISGVLKPMQADLQLEFLHTLYIVSVEKNNDRVISVIRHWLTLLRQNQNAFDQNNDGFFSGMGKLLLRAVPGAVVSDEKFQKILDDNLAFISEDKFPENEYAILYEDKVVLETFLSEKAKTGKDTRQSFFDKNIHEIAVQNAGIVILHPFLKHFFTHVKIINKRGNIIPGKCELAVQTLHFLATGNEEFFEGDLVFEKFLCGLPLHFPVCKESLLTREIKAETEIMLKEVIKNWTALKRTSPDGLRQMFLQREGKLIQKDKNFKLIIEQKTQDILLEKLSWNISIVKLKWLSEMLFVEW